MTKERFKYWINKVARLDVTLSGFDVELREHVAEWEKMQAENKAHRETLSRVLTAICPTGFEGEKAEEAFEIAIKCIVADRECRAELNQLYADRAEDTKRLDWLEKTGFSNVSQIKLNEIIPLREAIDAARTEKP